MKLRYFIPTLIAAIAMFVGCTSDDDPIYLDNIHVSTSYVTFAKEGTPVDITLTAAADWSIDEASVPEWLKITPMSGGAGEQTLKFSPEAGDSRSGIVKINCGGQTQEIIVEQELVDPDPITVSQALAVIRSGNIPSSALKVTGIVCKIQEISTSYGNATYFLSDDGSYGSDNWLEVYRGYWLDGEKFTDENAFSVGDELTIKGVLMLYNGSVPETVQGTASVVAINKSLIKVDSLDVETVPVEGGVVTAAVTCKGNGISVDIPVEAQSWLSVIGIDTQTGAVKFNVMPNTGDKRSATVVFKTTDSGKEYSSQTVISQEAFTLPHGKNPEDPFTVAEAIAKCQEIGATTDGEIYYAKGKISSIKEVSTSYGNATFNISDDGTENNVITVFRSYSLDNKKFVAEDEIGVGDEVVITGKLVNYTKDGVVTPEFSGNVYIYSIKKADAPAAKGTEENPFTVDEAIAKCQEIGATTDGVIYYAKGKISSIKEVSTSYGNATFNISDDGNDSNALTVFRSLDLGNQKFTDENKIKVGDEVIITGKLVNYFKNDVYTPEFSGNVYIYSLNGKTE